MGKGKFTWGGGGSLNLQNYIDQIDTHKKEHQGRR